jgi:hypothetical protein
MLYVAAMSIYEARVTGHFPDWPITERAIVALEDRGYVYLLKVEAAGELSPEDARTFERLVASIRPLPDRRREAGDAFHHWAA